MDCNKNVVLIGTVHQHARKYEGLTGLDGAPSNIYEGGLKFGSVIAGTLKQNLSWQASHQGMSSKIVEWWPKKNILLSDQRVINVTTKKKLQIYFWPVVPWYLVSRHLVSGTKICQLVACGPLVYRVCFVDIAVRIIEGDELGDQVRISQSAMFNSQPG